MENRNGLIVDARLTEANGTAERTTALEMIEDNAKPGSTVGLDVNYDTTDFVTACRERGCTLHVSQNQPTATRRSTRARPGTPAIASARSGAIGSKNHWGESRRSAACARPGIVAEAWSSGSSCSPPQPTISFVFRRCWQQRDEPVWSVKHQRKLRVQRSLPLIDWLILAPHIRKLALQDPFFSSLLSCLLSRDSIKRSRFRLSARTLDFEGAHGRRQGQRRRLIKLSCAGWLPHDRGFVLGLPRSRGRASAMPAHNRPRGFPTAPCLLPWAPIWSSSALQATGPSCT
ncbi:hypothetical protein ABIB80_007565 [Bradyrhizobium sp. i1.15.2]